MKLYDQYIVPALIRLVCSNRRFNEMRRSLVPHAEGVVLEIGLGSGLNLPYYNASKVKRIVALEPSTQLRRSAQQRIEHSMIPVEVSADGAESIALANHSIDSIVTTFTLCSIAEIQQALSEMRRVLKPDGNLLFCEHGRAPDAEIQRWQDRLNPYWKKMAGGCHLNRDIDQLITNAGFKTTQRDYNYMPGPKTMGFIYKGIAR
jgi:ubiquinone/menaquinone biosynthesis C-methylase UbiE